MPIDDRDLKPGAALVARYKGDVRTCEMVETPDGVRYRLDDGTEHKSPSSAGKAAMNGVACNGWRFWSLAGTREPTGAPGAAGKQSTKRTSTEKAKAKTARTKKAKTARAASAAGGTDESVAIIEAAKDDSTTHSD